MKKLKLLVVCNSFSWSSWRSQIESLRKWFLPYVDFTIDTIRTDFQDIPFTSFLGDENLLGISPRFYDNHFAPLGAKYDITMVVLPVSMWPAKNKARGWRANNMYQGKTGSIELQIAADEHEQYITNNRVWGTTFEMFAKHEILHALYMMTGQEDKVHYWWNQQPTLISRCLPSLDFEYKKKKLLPLLEMLVQAYQSLIALMTKPMTPSEHIAKLAREKENTDFTDDTKVEDKVSCAYAVTTILHEHDNRIPIIYGTHELDKYLSTSSLFERVLDPIKKMSAGWIWVAPSIKNAKGEITQHGHAGIYVSSTESMSNDSIDGLWKKNYTRDEIRKFFGQALGLPIRIYKKVV
ncbi:MAG TPA: hypothetical protein PK616_06110 [Fibrobacteraceae bacterium]|nr:hypothetical protein [Fibrobacteraceae bacterium]